jgi:hypothetical protein
MTLSGPLRKVASKLMVKFGGEATIRRITVGAYNTSTGTAAEFFRHLIIHCFILL